MEPALEDLKRSFTAIMMGVPEEVLSGFVWWLDHKLAEYKVYGQMIFKGSELSAMNLASLWVANGRSRVSSNSEHTHRNQATSLIPLQNVQKFVSLSSSAKRKQHTPCRRVPANSDCVTGDACTPRKVAKVVTSPTSVLKRKSGSLPVAGAEAGENVDERDHEVVPKIEMSSDVYFSPDHVVMRSSGRGRKIPFDTSGSLHPERNGIGFKCEICGAILQYKSGLNRHVLRHTSCKDYKCPMCNKLFHRKDNLVIHYKKVHCKVATSLPGVYPAATGGGDTEANSDESYGQDVAVMGVDGESEVGNKDVPEDLSCNAVSDDHLNEQKDHVTQLCSQQTNHNEGDLSPAPCVSYTDIDESSSHVRVKSEPVESEIMPSVEDIEIDNNNAV